MTDQERNLRRLLKQAVKFMSGRKHPTADFLNACRLAVGMKPRKLDEEGAAKVFARLRDTALSDLCVSAIAKSVDMTEHRAWRACGLLQQRGLVEEVEQPGLVLYTKRRWRITPKGVTSATSDRRSK